MSSLDLAPANAVVEECTRLRKNVQPISEKYHGLLDKSDLNNTKYPFVLLLGNHSSGKSSFINFLLKRKIQLTGVAPTDDGFTIIGHGQSDVDKNGPALVGDPDLGFSGLQTFGPNLVNHTHLKIRSDVGIKDFMIVDTPGMIDSPGSHVGRNRVHTGHSDKMDRGYNFEGVCRWYAERADVILLFFDPDKPGTTGETLSILTNSLVGLDHKLHIILNKADQFHRINDFARAYGSLCWNLSKVIPRKDLPKIHTMCLPLSAIQLDNQTNVSHNNDSVDSHGENESEHHLSLPPSGRKRGSVGGAGGVSVRNFFDQGRVDLDEAREEVLKEVFNAPRRRVDNEISRLSDNLNALLMHCNLVERATDAYQSKLWMGRLLVVGTAVLSVALTVGAGYLFDHLATSTSSSSSLRTDSSIDTPPAVKTLVKPSTIGGVKVKAEIPKATVIAVVQSSALSVTSAFKSVSQAVVNLFRFQSKPVLYVWCATGGLLSAGLVNAYRLFSLQKEAALQTSREQLETSFRQLYSAEITKKDQYVLALGDLVIDHLVHNFSAETLEVCPSVRREDKSSLTRILSEDVANLRRRASPNFPVLVAVSTPVRNASSNFWSSTDKKSMPVTPSDTTLLSRVHSDLSIAGSQSTSMNEFPAVPHIFSTDYGQSPAELQHSLVGLLIESEDLSSESLLLPEESTSDKFVAMLRDINNSEGEDYASPKELLNGNSFDDVEAVNESV